MIGWLVDRSAFHRIPRSPDAALWLERASDGRLSLATVTLLEMGVAARSNAEWLSNVRPRALQAFSITRMSAAIEDRAVDVQGLLAARGQHRAPSIPDLLLAATAELSGLTVLHVDKDYDLIAAVTGQPVERLRTD